MLVCKVDKMGRITIPKEIRETLDITNSVYLRFLEGKEIAISSTKYHNNLDMINKRLKSNDLRKSERAFLERLKEVL